MHRRTVKSSEQGFTFLTTLLDLLALLMLLPLIVLFFSFASAFSGSLDPKQLEWELFTADLQTYLTDVDRIEVIDSGIGIRTFQAESEYDVEWYDRVIRKQRFRQGHEIMLTGLERCTFQLADGKLRVKAEFAKGITLDETFIVTLSEQ